MTVFLKAYVRVSTFEQNMDRQIEGIKLGKVFTDKAKVARDCGI
jgi:DNA invertase Pin-like site-specific DNA recombinase